MVYLFIILGVIAFLAFGIFWERKKSKRLMELAASRPPLSKAEYIARMKAKGHDEELVSIMYDELQKHVPEGFSIYPEDNLGKHLGIDSEELGNIVSNIHKQRKKKPDAPRQ